jgi:exopolysaccharide production protein ExoZ
MEKRIPHLDYLRGLAALGIMIYHYISWSFGLENSNNVLCRFGIYGVSIFYILSGVTLYLVNFNKHLRGLELRNFIVKRIARIMPLLWLVIIITLFTSVKHFDRKVILMNITGTFGFVSPNSYIAGGSWSIGNELVFYFIFPFLLFITKLSRIVILFTLICFLSVHTFFGFYFIDLKAVFTKNWDYYVNPFNQVFFFVIGVFGAKFLNNVKISSHVSLIGIVVSLLIFGFLPTSNKNELIFGFHRFVFTLACLLLVFSFYKSKFELKGIVNKLLLWFGEISYSLYLLHPIVWYACKRIFKMISFLHENLLLQIFVSAILTFMVSHIIYKFYELKVLVFLKNKFLKGLI